MSLSEIMTRDVKTLPADVPLLDAMVFLREHSVRHVPVVDGDNALIGIVTDRDVKRATPSALIQGQREVWDQVVRDTPLSKIMTRDPVSLGPNSTIRQALQLFTAERIGCLPIVEGKRLVGIVTAHDLFKAMLKLLDTHGDG